MLVSLLALRPYSSDTLVQGPGTKQPFLRGGNSRDNRRTHLHAGAVAAAAGTTDEAAVAPSPSYSKSAAVQSYVYRSAMLSRLLRRARGPKDAARGAHYAAQAGAQRRPFHESHVRPPGRPPSAAELSFGGCNYTSRALPSALSLLEPLHALHGASHLYRSMAPPGPPPRPWICVIRQIPATPRLLADDVSTLAKRLDHGPILRRAMSAPHG